ncbi:hypothetical protein D3C79_845090 [compost metagenome]
MVLVAAMHLLQEHQIGAGGTHRLAQLWQDEAAVERREALVNVECEHRQAVHGGDLVDNAVGGGQGTVHGCAPRPLR